MLISDRVAGLMRILLTGVLAYSFLACGDPPPSKYSSQQVYIEDTKLGPGDLFEVRVFRQKDMSGEYAVNSEGAIAFPLIGQVQAAGKTTAEVEREIRKRLADGYLRDPHVTVVVKEYRSKKISVFGEVRKPGTLSYTEGMSHH